MHSSSQAVTVAKLGTAVTIAYASTYYLPAILAKDIAASCGVATPTVFLAFSLALLGSAAAGPFAGRLVDARGGRTVLSAANLIFAAGLAALSAAQGPVGLFAAWLLMGLGMSAGLYEAAFSSLVRIYGTEARSAITGITLVAGFASTLGWPLSTWLDIRYGWRIACLVWAGIHLFIALPLNLSLPDSQYAGAKSAASPESPEPPRQANAPVRRTAWLLAFVFGATWFVSTAMAAHLPVLLQAGGVSIAGSVFLSSLVGPAQVGGRLLEYSLLRHFSPLISARVASLAHALGALCFLAAGVPAGIVFTLLHGAGNGIMTIANGTLPLVFFGSQGFGARQGKLMMPARFAQAFAPYLFGLAIVGMGAAALWMTIALGVLACSALCWLRPPGRSH